MSFLLNVIGFVLVTGLAWVATLIGVSQTLVMPGAGILLAIGVILATLRARAGDI